MHMHELYIKITASSGQSKQEILINWLIKIIFLREFQPMTSVPDDNSLSSNQDTNQFLL